MCNCSTLKGDNAVKITTVDFEVNREFVWSVQRSFITQNEKATHIRGFV